MPRCKIGDICKMNNGPNEGQIVLILGDAPNDPIMSLEKWWHVEALGPVRIHKVALHSGQRISESHTAPPGQQGYARDRSLTPLPPPSDEETTVTEKELEKC